jgi:hypothetical protein
VDPACWGLAGMFLLYSQSASVAGVDMKFFRRFAIGVGTVAELLTYFGDNKRWWLLPMLIILFLFGALIMAAQSSVISPFIYSIF